VIRQQEIDLTVHSQLDSFPMMQRMSTFYYDEILPALEKVFEQFNTDEELIHISELELDLGSFTESALSRRYYTDQMITSIINQVELAIRKVQVQQSPPAQRQKRSLSVFNQWLFYMSKGYLPWNTVSPGETWFRLVLEAGATEYTAIEKLRELILSDPTALKRIVLQHNEEYLSHIAELLTATNQRELPVIVQEIVWASSYLQKAKISAFAGTRLVDKHSTWQAVLLLLASQSITNELTSLTIARMLIADYFDSAQISHFVQQKKFIRDIKTTAKTWIELSQQTVTKEKTKNKRGNATGKKSKEDQIDQVIPVTVKNLPAQEKQVSIKLALPGTAETDNKPGTVQQQENFVQEQSVVTIDEEGIYTDHAGLVLLHPFLVVFFRYLGLADNGSFHDAAAHQQAILLLYYLATGSHCPPEYELVIPKLLTGYSLNETLDTQQPLTQSQCEAADELLTDVIAQWEIMKGTSPAGLREAFLTRKGKLTAANESCLLQVEASSIDMLLDRLPWSTSYIKLPWMKEMLRVEWRTTK
jgi:hypothetical protein